MLARSITPPAPATILPATCWVTMTEDVAQAVVFLASEHAGHITGVSLPVDGGQLLT